MRKVLFTLLVFLAFISACTNPPYRGKEVLGADEFVMDSYHIKEGKFSILEMEGKTYEPLNAACLEPYPDVIHEGDVLSLVLYHPTRADLTASIAHVNNTIGFRVNGGEVRLPDLGAIRIVGLTLLQATDLLQHKYREEIKDVDVFLTYREKTERKVELVGLVSTPQIPVDGRMRLFEALAIAKVPAHANFFKSYVVRNQEMLPVDLYKLIKEGDMSQNIVMRGGDKVYIADPTASSIMVLGEVGKERVIDLPDGFMTLRKALAEAGGILPTGDRSFVQVIRGNILHPKIYTLRWEHVVRLPNDSMLLIPGDIVYVAATPLSEWNRFVNQLLPTLMAWDLITRGAKTLGINIP